jgi:hypothetical protein
MPATVRCCWCSTIGSRRRRMQTCCASHLCSIGARRDERASGVRFDSDRLRPARDPPRGRAARGGGAFRANGRRDVARAAHGGDSRGLRRRIRPGSGRGGGVDRTHGDEVVAIHAGAEYLVYFLGFSPGFPYLGGLPESIAAPRLETPRRRVAAGSVAIGGRQTGVYPMASPGGWRIIGRTALRLFDVAADPPVLLRMGDHVRFVPMRKAPSEPHSRRSRRVC